VASTKQRAMEDCIQSLASKLDTSTFTTGDLMKKPNGDTDAEERLQMWLSEVDEFGMMMMVVVNGARSTNSFC